ncbi:translation initiation factor IF-2-like [Homo sapiens]|uniref:translation initiation factor IF-2-like n=1 Tax=Homo sapiens TaxID=9606 RepID=UPI001FB10786|nr:translation initiation factor IF-2-like [Homo sapiens]XP_047282081.1 translation initiation factor IF-2-like [Homo sapiens]XP_047282082.1 translation initiation factor IF-2-like [Homo sapiens]XP_047282083.1 translation initiation factor IF-2-like [Homo sapiens]
MEVNLENILSRDCSSLSRDDLESSSIRRRRPCCGCRGRSRVKAGAGRGGRAEDRGRAWPGRFRCARAARRLRRAPGRGGRRGGRSARTRGPEKLRRRHRLGHGGSPARVPSPRSARRGLQGAPPQPGEARPGLPCGGAARRRGGGGRAEASASRGAGGGLWAATALSRLSQGAWDTGFLTFLQLSDSQEFCFSSGSNRLTL